MLIQTSSNNLLVNVNVMETQESIGDKLTLMLLQVCNCTLAYVIALVWSLINCLSPFVFNRNNFSKQLPE